MNKDIVKVVFVFLICFVLAVGACVLCACLFDRVEPLASAETVTLPSDGIVGKNLLLNSSFKNISSLPSPWVASQLTVSFTSSGVSCASPSMSTQGYFIYRVPYSTFTVGSTYTLSFFCVDLDIISETFTLPVEPSTSTGVFVGTRVGNLRIRVYHYVDGTIGLTLDIWGSAIVQWAKLELGSEFTGYVPNYDEIKDKERDYLYNYNKGWTSYSFFTDFKSTDQSAKITSSNGGTTSYISSTGLSLNSPSNGTQFTYFDNSVMVSSINYTGTLSIGYSGSFSLSSVKVVISYSYFTGTAGLYPWNGIDPVTESLTLDLDPNSVFVFTFDRIKEYPSIRFVCNANVDFVLTAVKFETGSIFTRFPVGGDNAGSYANGYSSGVSIGYDQGYNVGFDEGFESGGEQVGDYRYREGYTNGYNDGIVTADQGTWSNMLSSLINLPVTFILSLIHFEILGFDFANVFRIIVLFSLLSFIITKVLKGII